MYILLDNLAVKVQALLSLKLDVLVLYVKKETTTSNLAPIP